MRFEHNTFIGQRILVDGNEYHSNLFQDCVLVFAGQRPFQMSHNAFKNTRIEFTENAGNTLALIRALYHGGFKEHIEQLFTTVRQEPDHGEDKVKAPDATEKG